MQDADSGYKTIIDISVPISPHMPAFPGDPEIRFESFLSMDAGDVVNLARINIGTHAGTHVDTPHHVLNNNITLDNIPLEVYYGPAQVVELPEDCLMIDEAVLNAIKMPLCKRLLLKTQNSRLWASNPADFVKTYAGLSIEGAKHIIKSGIRLVGIDYLSIEPFGLEGLRAHRILLENGVVILEGINLVGVKPGEYILSALPIKYKGLDGAPVRAVLLK